MVVWGGACKVECMYRSRVECVCVCVSQGLRRTLRIRQQFLRINCGESDIV